jgi:hypothetical protein
MVRSLTSVAAGLTALATTTAAAAPASAQPIDLLAPPTLTAPPNDVAPSDTRPTTAAPMLGPSLASDEPPVALLNAARRALEAGRTGEAHEALERAETRLLSVSAMPVQASFQRASRLFSPSAPPGARSSRTIARAPSERLKTHWRQ